jgi:hypothetical protein
MMEYDTLLQWTYEIFFSKKDLLKLFQDNIIRIIGIKQENERLSLGSKNAMLKN